jgi:hypothetical protein
LVGWPLKITPPHITDRDGCLGRLGEPIGLPTTHLVKGIPHFKRVHPDLNIPFARVQGSFQGVYKGTERYFTPDVSSEDLPDYVPQVAATTLMKQIFKMYVGKCEPVSLGDTYINPKTSIGYVMKRLVSELYAEKLIKKKWRTKAEIYQNFPNLTNWMFQFSPVFKIPVLWETAGKAEILKARKANNGDIRTFFIGDPFFTLNYSNLLSGLKSLMIHFSNDFQLSPSRMGVSFVKGAFHKMMSELINMIVVKGDCIKWDASFRSCMDDKVREIVKYVLEAAPDSELSSRIDYFFQQSFESFVRMPAGELYEMLYKKSGDPWTTGGNIMGHLYILCAHLCWMARQLRIDPYRLYLKTRWNIYADDHINGYPKKSESFPYDLMPFLAFPHRERFYKAFGVYLHPPPEDVVQDGPLGGVFLGATVKEQYGRFVPEYSFERLIAILYCSSYSDEDLEEVIASISPLINTNTRASELLRGYVSVYYPHLLPLLDLNAGLFFGGEGGIEKDNEPKQQSQHTGCHRYHGYYTRCQKGTKTTEESEEKGDPASTPERAAYA